MTPAAHPDARAFTARRPLWFEGMAPSVSGAALAVPMTQRSTLAEAATVLGALAALGFARCCVWQVLLANRGTCRRFAGRAGPAATGLAGEGLVRALQGGETRAENWLIRLVRRARRRHAPGCRAGDVAAATGTIRA